MKHRSVLIAGMAGLLLSGAALAGESAPAANASPAKEESPKKADEPAQCTRAPGSHIRLAKPEDCAKVARGPYRSYSREDIDRTGETNLAEALRKLDPAFR